MERQKRTPFTIALWAAVGLLSILILILAPGTLSQYRQMQTELSATPTPTANVASALLITFDPNNTPTPTPLLLKTGSAGDEVSRLQQRLFALNFYTGEMDGKYGQGTAESVRMFQEQHGLTADGVAGSDTLTALYADAAQTFVPTPEPSPTPAHLEKGDKGDSVRALQERLQTLGYYTTSVDGDYGSGTEQAVSSFQSQHGLTADGIATTETLALLNSSQAQQVQATPTPDPAAVPMLVNKANPVPEGYLPTGMVNLKKTLSSDLVKVMGSDIQGDKTAVEALEVMLEAAQADGVTGFQISAGYRSVKYQQQLFDESVAEYIAKGRKKESAISATRLTVADPGASEHHTGLAFDMTVAGTSFKGTEQQLWLHKNCWDYGYIIRYQEDKEKITGIIAEVWHIRYVGEKHSKAMQQKNLCLEEYVEMLRK